MEVGQDHDHESLCLESQEYDQKQKRKLEESKPDYEALFLISVECIDQWGWSNIPI